MVLFMSDNEADVQILLYLLESQIIEFTCGSRNEFQLSGHFQQATSFISGKVHVVLYIGIPTNFCAKRLCTHSMHTTTPLGGLIVSSFHTKLWDESLYNQEMVGHGFKFDICHFASYSNKGSGILPILAQKSLNTKCVGSSRVKFGISLIFIYLKLIQ